MTEPAIELRQVGKRYGRTVALRELSFTVARGELVGFVGPNGAGKSSALRIATGFLDPDTGSVHVAGHDLARARAAAQAHIGYMPEAAGLYGDMRVDEYLRFRARLAGLPRARVRAAVDRAVERCDLGAERRRLAGLLSKGTRQRVGLAAALVAEPSVLILDEPTAGLDPVQTRAFRALLAGLRGERSVLISSHDLADIEAVADRMVVLARGRLVGQGTPVELRAQLGLAPDSALEEVFMALVEAPP
ncbi:ABC transporter ATP-binding protein [Haliangium sp.]|uniref:ABC transporter ATP-binding protein n=1 Tax=Haliangium sp. TaxID=2663208 RepID=UPI003D11065E